jgi:hypothetical protein
MHTPLRFFMVLAATAVLLSAGCSGASKPAGASGGGDSLDQAYQDLIDNERKFADLMAGVQDQAGARQAVGSMKELLANRRAIFERLAELGAEMPPQGIPPKFADPYREVQARKEQLETQLLQNPHGEQIQQFLIAEVGADLEASADVDLFRLNAELRRHGPDKRVMVELRNRESLAGPQHQKMARMLQDTAGAIHAEAFIEDDGTYYLVLAPVDDINAFVAKIDIGEVSQVDAAARKFVLTLDPSTIPEDATAGGPGGSPGGFRPGFPPGAAPGGPPAGAAASGDAIQDNEKDRIDIMRATFAGQQGRDGIVELHLKNAKPFQGPRMGKALAAIGRAAGGRLLQPIPLRSGDVYLFFESSADVNALASSLDLGEVESIDAPGRRIVVVLDETKVPE